MENENVAIETAVLFRVAFEDGRASKAQVTREIVMSEQIILTLPTAVYQQAEALARDSGRPVVEVLVERIERSLQGSSANDSSISRESQTAETQETEIPWTWNKDRQKIREAVRQFSEQINGDH